MFKSTCAIWLSGQIDQMSKWLVFGLVFQSNKSWFVIVVQIEFLKNKINVLNNYKKK
jgi:hypothetical protein